MEAVNGLLIAEILEKTASACLKLDASEKSDNIRYQDVDVMNALLIFMHICNNVAIHNYMDKGIPIDKSIGKHMKHGLQLRKFVKSMTGVDPSKFYPNNQLKNEQ